MQTPQSGWLALGDREQQPVTEVLLATFDLAVLKAHGTDEHSPVRRYEMTDLGSTPRTNTAIYRRHGIWPFAVSLSATGASLLRSDQSADILAIAARLSAGEFLSLQCWRWIDSRRTGYRQIWEREIHFVRYKIERARHARNRDAEAALRSLHASLTQKYAGHRELNRRKLEGPSVH